MTTAHQAMEVIRIAVDTHCPNVTVQGEGAVDVVRVMAAVMDASRVMYVLDHCSFPLSIAVGRLSIEAQKWAKKLKGLAAAIPLYIPPDPPKPKSSKHRVFKIHTELMSCVGGIPPNHDQLF